MKKANFNIKFRALELKPYNILLTFLIHIIFIFEK